MYTGILYWHAVTIHMRLGEDSFGHKLNERQMISHQYHLHTFDDNTWAATWQNQQNGCASSQDSDKPGHPPSLIRVFVVRMKKAWVLSYPVSAQRRLRSDWADAKVDLSLRWAHTHFVGFVMRRLTCRLTGITIWMQIRAHFVNNPRFHFFFISRSALS